MKRKRCCSCGMLTFDWANVNGYVACYMCWNLAKKNGRFESTEPLPQRKEKVVTTLDPDAEKTIEDLARAIVHMTPVIDTGFVPGEFKLRSALRRYMYEAKKGLVK